VIGLTRVLKPLMLFFGKFRKSLILFGSPGWSQIMGLTI
jgi:hypothetical protein